MLRTYFQETFYDMPVNIAQKYAEGIRMAIQMGKPFDGEKKQGFYLSMKGSFSDKLYVGNIHRIEGDLYYNDEKLADNDKIVNVVMLDGPVTRDGDGCSYGSKDHRDQIMYANTIPQVVGHVFIINTPGGAASARIDYEQAIADCREKGKPTVAWVDGMACSAGQLVAALCDRTIVMNGRHTMGCIGTMCAFWGVANGTVDSDGHRYIELVSVSCPDKNAEYRDAVDGKTEKLQAELDKLGDEFRNTVRQNRPLVKKTRLTGKTFDADDVMGELVDEIGDFNRAVEAVFELADGTIPAARLATPEQTQDETPKNNDDMEEETKKQEATAPANEQPPVATPETEAAQEAKTEGTEQAQPGAAETNKEPESETTQPEAEGQPEQSEPGEQPSGEQPAGEQPAGEQPAGEQPSEEAVIDAGDEIEKNTETLHHAQVLVEQKDKKIAELEDAVHALDGIAEERDKMSAELEEALAGLGKKDDAIATLNGDMEVLRKELSTKDTAIADMQNTINQMTDETAALKKKIADLSAEVKELSEKPAPMNTAESGVPADNSVGKTPQASKRPRISRNMTYEEVRAAKARMTE